jgi:hypothetical protein
MGLEEQGEIRRPNNLQQIILDSDDPKKSKEESLIEYTKFLAEKIKLVNKVIKKLPKISRAELSHSRKENEQYTETRFKLENLQFKLSTEIVKIRDGAFSNNEMSALEKSAEAKSLIEDLSYKQSFKPPIEKFQDGRLSINHGRSNWGDFEPYSKGTLNTIDKTIKSLIKSVNLTESLLARATRSGRDLGR